MAAGTENMTGSIVATLLFILMVFFVIGMMFGIALELMGVLLLPMMIACAAYYNTMMTPLIVILIYLSALISKHWLFR